MKRMWKITTRRTDRRVNRYSGRIQETRESYSSLDAALRAWLLASDIASVCGNPQPVISTRSK